MAAIDVAAQQTSPEITGEAFGDEQPHGLHPTPRRHHPRRQQFVTARAAVDVDMHVEAVRDAFTVNDDPLHIGDGDKVVE